jgi:hypothetical protein
MRRLSRDLAAAIYRQSAKASAYLLASSASAESILVHRSVATGEVRFGRSDIDLLMVIGWEAAGDGAKIASLYRNVRRLRLVNPALSHIEVYEPDGIPKMARTDTFWGSITRRSAKLLRGKPITFPLDRVNPEHALSRFLLWVEWFFAISVQCRNPRNVWKTALECWNAYATAEGLIPEPYLLRSDMEVGSRETEGDGSTGRLNEPESAARFVFGLADRLHRSRLPELRRLRQPIIFEATIAPLWLHRLFVVLPHAGSPLPPEAFAPGAFPCTPEALDLYLHFKNAFLYWTLPPELLSLGMQPPSVEEFVRDCRYYCHNRFLYLSGFATPRPSPPAAPTVCIRHALEWLNRGEPPPALPREKSLAIPGGTSPADEYYRTEYGLLHSENRKLQESLYSEDSILLG